jgi:methionyl-tRNA formyltransferase
MRIIFAGTPEFATVALEQIYLSGHELVLVLTQPDRPAGRGLKLQASSVKKFALDKSLPIFQPHGLKLDGKFSDEANQAKDKISLLNADLMIVAAYGLILPRWALEATKYGCLNIHASLLPQWRGAAPIHRAVMAGNSETGICIMQMDEGLDTGDVLLSQSISIDPLETTADLHDKLSKLGGHLITQAIEQIDALKPIPQIHSLASYAHKISKEESILDWNKSSKILQRQVLGLNPSPGSSSQLDNEMFKIWHAHALETDSTSLAKNTPNGCIVNVSNDGIDVQCQEGLLRITQLQRAGHKKMPLSELLKGKPISVGTCFS